VIVEVSSSDRITIELIDRLKSLGWSVGEISGNRVYVEKIISIDNYRLRVRAFIDTNKHTLHVHSFHIEPLKLTDVDEILEELDPEEWSFNKEGGGVLFWRNNPHEYKYSDPKKLEEELLEALRLGLKLDISKLLGLDEVIHELVEIGWLTLSKNLNIEGRRCITGRRGTVFIEFKALIIAREAEMSLKVRAYPIGVTRDLISKLRSMEFKIKESKGIVEAISKRKVGLSVLPKLLVYVENELSKIID